MEHSLFHLIGMGIRCWIHRWAFGWRNRHMTLTRLSTNWIDSFTGTWTCLIDLMNWRHFLVEVWRKQHSQVFFFFFLSFDDMFTIWKKTREKSRNANSFLSSFFLSLSPSVIIYIINDSTKSHTSTSLVSYYCGLSLSVSSTIDRERERGKEREQATNYTRATVSCHSLERTSFIPILFLSFLKKKQFSLRCSLFFFSSSSLSFVRRWF